MRWGFADHGVHALVSEGDWRSSVSVSVSAALAVACFSLIHWTRALDESLGAPVAVEASAGASQSPGKMEPTIGQLIGLDRLERRLGADTPKGTGLVAGHVEGQRADYLPNRNAEAFRGVAIAARSGEGKVNGHAHATAAVVYGPQGLAPGIGKVDCYNVPDFLGSGLLNTNAAAGPVTHGQSVYNHSWVGRNLANVGDALRRIDYVIDTYDTIMVVGVDNGRSSRVPALLSSAYNVIAVGEWHGNSSGGYTLVETAGRCKPDIVAPGGLTSYATPVVTAAVARLLETAIMLDAAAKASRAEVIKAVVLAGATKPEHWQPESGKPLDGHLGAGRLNLDLSHTVLSAGPPRAYPTANRFGWEFAQLEPDRTHTYGLDLAAPMAELSLVLVWHRRVRGFEDAAPSGQLPTWSDEAAMANLDLAVMRRDDPERSRIIARSDSRVDNVEHIFLRSIEAGRYRIEVDRKDALDETWDYAIAWRIEP